ncbi:MAG: Rha family transcriptional regulator, partial [Plesiomonas sp.]
MAAICSENIDFTTFGRYSSVIAAKSAIRGRSLKVTKAHNRAQSGFFMRAAQLHPDMVGWAGASSEAPASLVTGTANPAQFTTNQSFAALGGELLKITKEAATMVTTPAISAPEIRVINGHAVTTSLAIADYFTKRHDDVLKRIRNLECSAEFNARNFAAVEYTDSKGEKRPAYQITRDGFAFLAMGFTGKRAAQFKEAYIAGLESIDFTTFGRYSSVIAAKSAIRIGVLKVSTAHNRAQSGFFMRNAQLHPDMVGWAGASQDAPVSVEAGTPTLFSSPPVIGVIGGDYKNHSTEAAVMATTPAISAPEVRVFNGQAVTTSIDVADYFGRQHHNVIQRIKNLECSAEFNALNFKAVEYTDLKGEKRPAYQITRDGFAFLAMGFTGKRAAQFKEAYITAFNRMESHQTTYLIKHEQSNAEYNLGCVRNNLLAINTIWDESLYPMLVAMESPLATRLHDRIKDALFCSVLVKKSLGG